VFLERLARANRVRATLLLKSGGTAERDRALALVEQNLKNEPSGIEDLELKAAILAKWRARRSEAIKILEQLAGAKRLTAGHRFLLAKLYLDERDDRKYEKEMVGLLSGKTNNSQVLTDFIRFLIARKRPDQADRWLAELKKIEPQGPSALELEARLLDLQRRKPELRTLLIARGRRVPDQIGFVASLLDDFGFSKEAEEAYRAFIAREPGRADRLLALAQFLARRDRISEAMEILTKAWSMGRPEQVAATALAVYDAPSSGENQKRQVEAWVAEAVRKRPEAVRLTTKLGLMWIREGRFSDAEQLLRRLLARDPENADALNALAWLLAMQDQRKSPEALGLIDRAIEIRGPDSELLDTRAVVRIRAGQPGKAIDDLMAVHQVDPANAASTAHLGWAYHVSGQADLAKTAFHKAGALGWTLANADPLERAVFEKLAPGR
jgi:tetratricopeptide (TPR) repeat protein